MTFFPGSLVFNSTIFNGLSILELQGGRINPIFEEQFDLC